MTRLAPCTSDMFCKRSLQYLQYFFWLAQGPIREECAPLILEDASGHESASVPLGALFHAAAFGISTGPQGLSTWRIARWHSHTSLKHAAAPTSLSPSLWHSLSFSSSVFPPFSLHLCMFNPFQIFSKGFKPQPSLNGNVCCEPTCWKHLWGWARSERAWGSLWASI